MKSLSKLSLTLIGVVVILSPEALLYMSVVVKAGTKVLVPAGYIDHAYYIYFLRSPRLRFTTSSILKASLQARFNKVFFCFRESYLENIRHDLITGNSGAVQQSYKGGSNGLGWFGLGVALSQNRVTPSQSKLSSAQIRSEEMHAPLGVAL